MKRVNRIVGGLLVSYFFQGTEDMQLPTFNIPSEILNVVGQDKVS